MNRPPPRPTSAKPGLQRPSGAVPSRPTSSAPTAAPNANAPVARKPNAESKIKVYSKIKHTDDSGIPTLLGDYVERGMNHGRKFYEKFDKIPGYESVKVFIYYWDDRDGKDFCGWWFGDKVGGSQVWSRADAHGQLPPREGWKVPWDGPYVKDMLLVDVPGAGQPTKPTSAAPSSARMPSRPSSVVKPPARSANIEATAEQVETIQARANEALNIVREGLAGEVTEEILQELEETLAEQQSAVNTGQKVLAQEIEIARDNGENITALTKLAPRMRALQTALIAEVDKVKDCLSQANKRVVDEQRRHAERMKTEQANQRDQQQFQEVLATTTDIVAQAEDSVETVSIMASSVSMEDDEEFGEDARRTMDDIDEAVNKAQNALADAKKHLTTELSSAKRYSEKTRKLAMQSLSDMQTRLAEANKKLGPFKRFKREWEQKLMASKTKQEILKVLAVAEMDVEKAHIMSSASLENQLSIDEIKSAEALLSPALTGISKAQKLIADKKNKIRDNEFLAKELDKLDERAKQSKTQLDEVKIVLQSQREGLKTQDMLQQLEESIGLVNDALEKTSEVELPFLKGMDVLPVEEGRQAIGECEDAIVAAESAINQARTQIKAKQADAKQFSSLVVKRFTNELNDLSTRVESFGKKLGAFKKLTSQRKTKALLQEVADEVQNAEDKVRQLADTCKLLVPEDFDSISMESLKQTCESSVGLEKSASEAVKQAKQVLVAKEKNTKDGTSNIIISTTAFKQLQERMNTAFSDLAQHQRTAATGDKLIKSKELLAEEDAKLKALEDEFSKVEELTTSSANGKSNEESMKKIDSAVSSVQTSYQSLTKSLTQMKEGALAPVKTALTKLIVRSKVVQDGINKVKAYCAEQKELVLSEVWIAAAVAKIEAIDKAMKQVGVAELPFLKGIEILPGEESQTALLESEKASDAAQKAISEARDYIATQLVEAKKFKGEKAKDFTSKELNKLTEKIGPSSTTASKFKKDTETRRRSATMQETVELVTSLEAEVENVTEAALPLQEGGESLPPDAAKEVCKNLAKLEKAAQARIDHVKGVLDKRVRDMKGHAREEEQINGLHKKLQAGQAALTKAKNATGEHEQRFVAKTLITQATDLLKDAETDFEKANTAAAPLIVDGGALFLAAGQMLPLVKFLKDQMQTHETTVDKFFEQLCGDERTLSKAAFEAYLEKLPDEMGQDDLTYSAEQRSAIFSNADADKDGSISLADFTEMFSRRFICIKSVSMTDGFEISSSKTVAKLEIDEVVEFLGDAKPAKGGSLDRVECKAIESGKTGWVTMKGNQGTQYFETFSPYDSFGKTMERLLEGLSKSTGKAASFVKSKSSDLANYKDGPLANAATELEKLKPRISEAQKKVQDLKIKLAEAKKDYIKREEIEKNTQQEMRDKKAAAVLLKPITEKVEIMENILQKFLDAANTLGSATGAALEAVVEPITVAETAEKDALQLNIEIKAVKASVSEQLGKLPKAAKGPMNEAKQELLRIHVKAEKAEKTCSSTVESVKKARNKLATAQLEKLGDVFRSEIVKKDATIEALFSEIAGNEHDKITEEAFCKYVAGREHVTVPAEHVKLVFQQIEGEGIGRTTFNRVFKRYYICVKSIAITSEFTISKSKTNRMLELKEILEVLEGPKPDEKLGISRVRAKALSDGASGWISLTGNQGTAFLKEISQPCYVCTREVSLEKEFLSGDNSDGTLRSLKIDEVFEVLEGPRKHKFDDASRAKAKACKDGKEGWFTVKSRDGSINAEKLDKHYTCTTGIAITDARDIKKGKSIRKLEKGETCLVLDGPIEESNGIKRIHARSLKDGQEGWVTVKGNAGTVYAEENTKLYTLLSDTSLQNKLATDSSPTIRMLSKGEVVEVIDGPRDEKSEEVLRLKGRATHDGAVGWVTLKSNSLKAWTPSYKCVTNTVIHNSLAGKTAQVVRKIEVDEMVEVLDGPREDADMGVMRIKGRSEKDSAVGWITIKGNQGSVFLKPL